MTIDELRRVHRTRPFEPFVMHLADGRRVAVRHPEFLAQSPGGRTVYVASPAGGVDRIDLLLVVSIETLNGRGQQRGRRRAS